MKRKAKLSELLQHELFSLTVTLIVLCMIMSLMSDKFFTSQNIINLLRQSAQYGICAIGMTMLILLGGIDLSVGSVQALAGVGAVVVLNATGSIPAAVCTGVLIGALVGLMNSLIITKMKITPLICTLGTMSVISGVALVSTRATSIQVTVRDYMSIGMGRLAGIPVPVLILAVLIGVFYFILNHTTFGRYIYAIGGNKSSAELAGIPVDKIIIAAYIISGMLTGLSAVILSARLGSGQPSAGTGFEMTVIAAVIIGGVSLAGGKGSLIGALIGTLTLYVLNNGLVLLDVSSFWQDIMRGALIIVAVYVDQRRQSKSSRELLRAKFAVSAPDRGVE